MQEHTPEYDTRYTIRKVNGEIEIVDIPAGRKLFIHDNAVILSAVPISREEMIS